MSTPEEIEAALPERPLTPEEVDRIAARIQARSVSTLTHEDPETGEDRVALMMLLTRQNRVALWIDHGPDGWDVDPIAAEVSEREFAQAVQSAWGDLDAETEGQTYEIRGSGRHAQLEEIETELYGGSTDE
jgi:hypothetical protein